MGNQSRGAVLAEPLPWTVSQGVILVLVIVNSLLYVVELGMPTEITTLEPYRVRLQVASIFASVLFRRNLLLHHIICRPLLDLMGGDGSTHV